MRVVAIAFLLILLAGAGCATVSREKEVARESGPESSLDQQRGLRNQGYSLLHQLLADESNVSKLLIIKKENADVGALLKKISQTAGKAAERIEAFSKADTRLHLKMDGLPVVEKETRELIAKTRAKELITKGGEKFELRILLTQAEALSYGTHLAAVVQAKESEPSRKAFLGEVSRDLLALHQEIIDLMHARWDFPARK